MLHLIVRHCFASLLFFLSSSAPPQAEGVTAPVRTGESVPVQKVVQAYTQQPIIITKESVCQQAGCCYADDNLDENALLINLSFPRCKADWFCSEKLIPLLTRAITIAYLQPSSMETSLL